MPVQRHEVDEGGGAARRFEIGLEDQGAVAVSALRCGATGGRHTPMPVLRGPEQRREHRSGIETRPAQPVNRAIARDESRAFAVANKSIVLDTFCHGFR